MSATTPSVGRVLGRIAVVAATGAVLTFGCLSIVRLVDPANLRAAGTPEGVRPIVFDDHALQFYYGRLGSLFLAEGRRTHGYDPSFLAGYPKTPAYYPSSRLYELALWLFRGADPGRVFNWTVLVLLAALPFLTYAAAWSLGLSAGERLVVAALTTIPHLLAPIADFYRYMEPAGMESYIFTSALSVLVVSLFARFVRSGGVVAGLALWTTAPLLYFAHPTAVVLSALPIAVTYAVALRRMPARRHVWLLVVGATVLVANWTWIEGQILFGHYADLRDFYTPGGRAHFVPEGGMLSPFHTLVPTPKALALLPPIVGCAGMVLWWRERRWPLVVVVLPQILFLFVVSFYGRYLNLSAIAPGRIALPLGLWLFLPAAHGVVRGIARLSRLGTAWAGRPVGGPAAVALVSVLLFFATGASQLRTLAWRSYTFPFIERWQGFTQHGVALMRWLADHTDHQGRLLHEETNRQSHQYYGSHMAALIPMYTGLELAGGPAPYPLLRHNVLRFEAGTLGGQPLARLPAADVLAELRRYNVRWVLCWTPEAKRYFAALDGTTPIGSYDKFTLYRTSVEPTFFLEGSGGVEARENRIVLRDVVPEAGRIALKYHWLETLRTEPPRPILPLYVADEPVPFIVVIDPPRELVIHQDYGVGAWDWLRGRLEVSPAAAGAATPGYPPSGARR